MAHTKSTQQENYDAEQNNLNFNNSDSGNHQHQFVQNIVSSIEIEDGGSHDDVQLEETVYVSGLESALGRRWTVDDAMRIFNRMDQEIENRGGSDVMSGLEYDDILHLAIHQDLENLRSNGELGPDWTEHNMGDLFPYIIQQIENLVINILESENPLISRDLSDDDGLSEEIISKYLKRRCCDEVVRDKELEICVVCQDQLYKENETVAYLGCGHAYHVYCIKQWLRGKNLCPLCRAKVVNGEDVDDYNDDDDQDDDSGNTLVIYVVY
ncbi:hypothetical protein DH2020_042623 [Rehmannia glutinosa]|uniref:RING-type E3 ubiquitin transferase n=1 Tax=Rehmannia glutinosa TaxID=99300 RepID=A0ABR0ULX8_REHGL